MSDLAATHCMDRDCKGNSNSWIWIILLLCFCGGGNGGCGIFGNNGSDGCDCILPLLLILCCCGKNNDCIF